jgi:hypothetical protein
MVVLGPDAAVAPPIRWPAAADASGVLTNAAKNGHTSRHDGSADEAANLGTIGLRGTERYETARRRKNYWF